MRVMRGSYPKLTDEQQRELIARYRRGEFLKGLGEAFGVSGATVRNTLMRHGVPRRSRGGVRKPFTKAELADVRSRYFAGASQAAIAEVLGTSQIRVSRILREQGIGRLWAVGKNHGLWKGGRTTRIDGYTQVLVERDDPFASMRTQHGYVLEHRIVMARALGRPLDQHETVHHINGDRGDNRVENLQLRSGKHGTGVRYQCGDCGSFNVRTTTFD